MNGTVLIVEDDETQRAHLASVLEELGFSIKTAANGIEALSAAVIGRPDLIILDLFMPHLGGYSVLRELRKEPRTASIPIAIVSAHAEEHHREKAKSLGASAYLAKPFQPEELARVVSDLLPAGVPGGGGGGGADG